VIPNVHPQVESYRGNVNPLGPRGLLRRGQAFCAEDAVLRLLAPAQAAHQSGAYLQHLRPRACIPTMAGVVSNFIVQALKGEDITIYGDGMQTRAFLLRRRPDRRLAAPDGPHARRIHRAGQSRQPCRAAGEANSPRRSCSSSTASRNWSSSRCRSTIPCSAARTSRWRARRLKWEPKVALDQGLAKTIAYFDGLLKSNKEVSRVGR